MASQTARVKISAKKSLHILDFKGGNASIYLYQKVKASANSKSNAFNYRRTLVKAYREALKNQTYRDLAI